MMGFARSIPSLGLGRYLARAMYPMGHNRTITKEMNLIVQRGLLWNRDCALAEPINSTGNEWWMVEGGYGN